MTLYDTLIDYVKINTNNDIVEFEISINEIENLKRITKNYWELNLQNKLNNLKNYDGLKCFIWGGEAPREPIRLITKLILGGYDKIVLYDQFSHIFFRDNMLSTYNITDRKLISVYKPNFLIIFIKQYFTLLYDLQPLIGSGIVELIPPPILWSQECAEIISKSALIDYENENYKNMFSSGSEFGVLNNKVKTNYEETNKLYHAYNKKIKMEGFIKTAHNTEAEYFNKLMVGPSEELNEALYVKSSLSNSSSDVTLITDIDRHWDRLKWKLNCDQIDYSKYDYSPLGISLIDELPAKAIIDVINEGMLNSIRTFFQDELLCSKSTKELQKIWTRKKNDIDENLNDLKRKFVGKYIFNSILVSYIIINTTLSTFPEWLPNIIPPMVGTSSIKDIFSLYKQYKNERKKIISRLPTYLLMKSPKRINKDYSALSIDLHRLI